MKIYVTKYALTEGILELEATPCGDGFPDMYEVGYAYYHKNDYRLTMEEAQEKAKDMAVRKKKSLLKSIAKLEKEFGV